MKFGWLFHSGGSFTVDCGIKIDLFGDAIVCIRETLRRTILRLCSVVNFMVIGLVAIA